MMVSYELAFDSNFDWVKGGKLPGLRGGLNSTGCSGGNQADGLSCFSTRLMWRRDGEGEGMYVNHPFRTVARIDYQSMPTFLPQAVFVPKNPSHATPTMVSLCNGGSSILA
jgi:hypothetical protein